MDDYGNEYRKVFPLWCELDILDAHDYREEFFDVLRAMDARIDSVF